MKRVKHFYPIATVIYFLVFSFILDTSYLVNAGCSSDQFQCQNGKCTNLNYRCDSDNDCGDNSDETGCVSISKCSNDQFKCFNGKCITGSYKCDFDNDCGDRSDELNCGCSSDRFKCRNGKCINAKYRCDSDDDCGDGSDEAGCSTTARCNSDQLKCFNGKCVTGRWRCDGGDDCGLQPTPATKTRQLDLWTKFLQSHCKASNQFILTRSEPIFTNDGLKRSLSNDFVTELFNHIVESGNGVPNTPAGSTAVSPSSPKHGRGKGTPSQHYHESIIILFLSKEKWFEKLYDYAKRNGLQNGGIATAFEILNDDHFTGMDSKVLDILLRGMMRETRKCEVMEGSDGATEGVKFF